MKTLIILILSLTMTTTVTPNYKTIVTDIYEDDQIRLLVNYNGHVKEKIMHSYDFNNLDILHLSEEIPTQKAVGKFHSTGEWYKGEDYSIAETYYQFKSNDDKVWWALTETEIGFVPSAECEYVLLYCDNNTTAENKDCGCLLEWECECEVYDDIFLGLFEVIQKEERK